MVNLIYTHTKQLQQLNNITKMIKLGGLVSLQPINEAEYVHVGYGKYKEKGKEKDPNAQTFEKDDNDKFTPISSDKAAKGGDSSAGKDVPKVNIFDKPKEEPKKDTTDYSKLTTTDLVKKTKDDKSKINKVVEDILANADDVVKNGAADGGKSPKKIFKKLKDYIQALRDTNQFDDDALNKAYYYANDVGNGYEFGGDENPKDSDEDSIKNSVEKIQNLIKPKKDKEEPKSEPAKDSTGDRAGNPEVNKKVRAKAQKMGITPQKLGKAEYQKKMAQAAVAALTDANFHSEARQLIAKLEGKPEWAEDPRKGEPDMSSPEWDEWNKNSVYSSEYYDADDDAEEIGLTASNESSWDGRDALDSIAFDLKMNGLKNFATKLQSVIKEGTSTKLNKLLPENIINEGTRSQVGVIKNGKIISAYVHYDGYPSNMKPGLKKHMKDEKDVMTLIKKGGASGIFDDKEIEYYKSGTPLTGDASDIEGYIKDASHKESADYVYLYNTKDKKWYYADTYKDTKLKKLF